MAEQTIVIHIQGFWRDQHKNDLKDSPGIFFVYEAKFNKTDQTVDLLHLIYIGDADNIRTGILNHESYPLWQKSLTPGNELCYAFAPVDSYYRERVKAAYILTHKPPANTNTNESFQYDKTTLVSTGSAALVDPVITVRRTTPVNPGPSKIRQRNGMVPVRSVQVFANNPTGRRYAFGE
jgi:hypothetical protein